MRLSFRRPSIGAPRRCTPLRTRSAIPIRRWPRLSMLLALAVPIGAGWAIRRPKPLVPEARDGTGSFASKTIRVAHPARPRRYRLVAGLRSWRAVKRPPVRDRLPDKTVRWLRPFRIGQSPLNANRRRRPGWVRAILLGTPARRLMLIRLLLPSPGSWQPGLCHSLAGHIRPIVIRPSIPHRSAVSCPPSH